MNNNIKRQIELMDYKSFTESKFEVIINYDYSSPITPNYENFLKFIQTKFEMKTESTYLSKKKYTLKQLEGLKRDIIKIINPILKEDNSSKSKQTNIYLIYNQNNKFIFDSVFSDSE